MANESGHLQFEAGVPVWRGNIGTVRDVVRQRLVTGQLEEHLPAPAEPRLRVLDSGCGQGTQALRLARLGHTVLGVDVSHRLLQDAREAGEALTALVAAARPGALLSLLTRNQAGIAMRAGMSKDWHGALGSFDRRTYTNRLGVANARAHTPAGVRSALAERRASTIAWYGVRLFCDHWPTAEPPPDIDALVAVEYEAGRRDPYRSLGALTHTIAQVGMTP